MIKAGELDQQITFQTVTETNVNGELQQAWADDSPLDIDWCKIISQHGDEAFQAARVDAHETVRVKMRYRDDVQTTWRFTWNSQIYYVRAVDRSQRRQGELWLTAELSGAL